jgi:hypothetical protein
MRGSDESPGRGRAAKLFSSPADIPRSKEIGAIFPDRLTEAGRLSD